MEEITEGPDVGAYSHVLFRRELPRLCQQMRFAPNSEDDENNDDDDDDDEDADQDVMDEDEDSHDHIRQRRHHLGPNRKHHHRSILQVPSLTSSSVGTAEKGRTCAEDEEEKKEDDPSSAARALQSHITSQASEASATTLVPPPVLGPSAGATPPPGWQSRQALQMNGVGYRHESMESWKFYDGRPWMNPTAAMQHTHHAHPLAQGSQQQHPHHPAAVGPPHHSSHLHHPMMLMHPQAAAQQQASFRSNVPPYSPIRVRSGRGAARLQVHRTGSNLSGGSQNNKSGSVVAMGATTPEKQFVRPSFPVSNRGKGVRGAPRSFPTKASPQGSPYHHASSGTTILSGASANPSTHPSEVFTMHGPGIMVSATSPFVTPTLARSNSNQSATTPGSTASASIARGCSLSPVHPQQPALLPSSISKADGSNPPRPILKRKLPMVTRKLSSNDDDDDEEASFPGIHSTTVMQGHKHESASSRKQREQRMVVKSLATAGAPTTASLVKDSDHYNNNVDDGSETSSDEELILKNKCRKTAHV